MTPVFFRRFVVASVFALNFLYCIADIVVDTVNPICQEERDYNNRRADHSFRAMQSFLEQNMVGKPNAQIAGCLSGGGYRAMISSTAFLHALEDIGLLGAVKYVASLSGSTWALGHMLARDCLRPQPLTMQEFSAVIKQAVSNIPFFDIRTLHLGAILEKVAQISWEMHIIQPADIWGSLLADRLMHDLQDNGFAIQNITFGAVRDFLGKSLKYPFPIFTASIDDLLPYQWMEINPFVAGGDHLTTKDKETIATHYAGAYIPTYALGSNFKNGSCDSPFNEKSIWSMLGIFGSPYSASLADILKLMGQEIENYLADKIPNYWERRALDIFISELTEYFCAQKKLNVTRFLPTRINNFVYEMDSVLKDLHKFTLSDAGFDENIPILPLLKKEREVNIILICDASSDATWKDHPEISRTRDMAHRYGFKFPSLANAHVINDNLIIYEDTDPSVPTIVYFTNSIYEPTLKFDYTAKEFDELYAFMYNLVRNNKSILQRVILSKMG